MQKDLFLPTIDARIKELHSKKEELSKEIQKVNDELINTFREGFSIYIAKTARLCRLPSGRYYFSKIEIGEVETLFEVDLDLLANAIEIFRRNEKKETND